MLEYLGTTVAGTINSVYAAANLPVITVKMKVDVVGANNRVFIGMSDAGAAVTTMPTNGIFFSNCTASATCAANWNGVVNNAGTVTTVSCGAVDTAHFAFGRIEVRSTSDVHFFMDTNASDGVVETECGTGLTATPSVAMTPLIQAASVSTAAATNTTNFDIDYFRSWQDDSAELSSSVVKAPTEPTVVASLTPTLTTDQIGLLLGDLPSADGLTTLVSTIQAEPARDPVAIIGQKITGGTQLLTNFISARVTSIRGYFDEVFAKKIHTDQLCVNKSDGHEVCVTGDQLDVLLHPQTSTITTP
jgi:hypothetical protein